MNNIRTTRIGNYIYTYSGTKFYPLDPYFEEVKIEDIAHGLSNICRFNGHTFKYYSVAEHCVHVSNHVPIEHSLWGLLHDAAEAYISDVQRPIKVDVPQFSKIEEKIMIEVCTKFHMSYTMPPEVKEVDNRILEDEAFYLINRYKKNKNVKALGIKPECWSPDLAKQMFLKRYLEVF